VALATLSIDVVAKLASLEQGMTKAGRIVEQNAARISKAFGALRNIGGALATIVPLAAINSAIGAYTEQMAAIQDLADATGASINNLSALEDVARRTGGTFETAGAALLKFNQALNASEGTERVAAIFSSIGLNAAKLREIDPAEALRQTAVALAGFADDGNKARLGLELFGRSWRELAPFMNDLAEQTRLVGTQTAESVRQADEFGKKLAALRANANDTARAFAGPLVTALNSYLESLNKAGGFTGSLLARLGLDDQSKLQDKSRQLSAQIKIQADEIEKFQSALNAAPNNERFIRGLADAKARMADLSRQALQTSGDLKVIANGLVPLPGPDGGARPSVIPPPPEPKKTTPKVSEAQRYLEQLQKESEKLLELTKFEQALQDVQLKRIEGLTPKLKEAILQEAQFLDLKAEQNKEAEREADIQKVLNDIRGKEVQARSAEIAALAAASATGQLEEQRRVMVLLAEAYTELGWSQEMYADVVNTYLGNTKDTLDDVNDFAKQAAANIQDSLGKTLRQTLDGDFKSIGRLWGDLMLDLAAQAAAAQLGKALFGGDFGKTGNLGGFIGSLFGGGITGFARGGVFNGPQLFPFANGGSFKTGVMGEAGPEGILPLKRGKDGKLGVISSGGGGGSVVNNISVGAGVNRGEVMALMQAYGQQLKGEILQTMGGGAYGRA
jgi:hypothetical protein